MYFPVHSLAIKLSLLTPLTSETILDVGPLKKYVHHFEYNMCFSETLKYNGNCQVLPVLSVQSPEICSLRSRVKEETSSDQTKDSTKAKMLEHVLKSRHQVLVLGCTPPLNGSSGSSATLLRPAEIAAWRLADAKLRLLHTSCLRSCSFLFLPSWLPLQGEVSVQRVEATSCLHTDISSVSSYHCKTVWPGWTSLWLRPWRRLLDWWDLRVQ